MKKIEQITVVGVGTMGHGIAQECARGGYQVVMYHAKPDALARAKDRIHVSLEKMVGWGLLSGNEIPDIMERLHITTSFREACEGADLVIEAVPENLELKQQVFRDLDSCCPQRTILASNTSSLMPSSLAIATKRPDRVAVSHFIYPPHLMPLVEIVRGEGTSDETIGTLFETISAIGKRPVMVRKEAVGFIVNRLQLALFHEAVSLIEHGVASAEDVDTVVKQSFGRRMAVTGPLELIEVMDGWDALWAVMQYILPTLDPPRKPSPLVAEMVKQGKLGAKRGVDGFYQWTPASAAAWSERLEDFLASMLRTDLASENA